MGWANLIAKISVFLWQVSNIIKSYDSKKYTSINLSRVHFLKEDDLGARV